MPQDYTPYDDLADKPPDFKSQGEQWALGVTADAPLGRVGKAALVGSQLILKWSLGFIITAASWIAIKLAKQVMAGEDRNAAAFRDLTHTAIQDLTGIDSGNSKAAIGRQIMEALSGGAGAAAGGTLEPSTAGAEKYMELVMNLALESYVEGGITSALSLGYLDKFTELDDILANVLGLSRMTRAVMRPLMTAKVITPMQWHVNKAYRPELLSPGDAVRQLLRGRWSRERVFEELARQGWTDERIEALTNAQRKFFSVADVRTFYDRQHWDGVKANQHLYDQGYDQATAEDALRLEGLKRIDALEGQEAALIIAAYASHDIEHADFTAQLAAHVSVPTERAFFEELGELRRALNIRHLSSGQVEACVKAGVLAFIDYRAALRREGYTEDAITALELLLRFERDKATTIEKHRAELEADRALEKKAKADAAAQRRQDVEAERALRRRGSLGDLERAAIRGLISFARVEEILAPQYDADTVEILVGLIEADRQTYLAQQAAANAARQRAARRDLDVGALEAAVLANELDLGRFRQRLEQLRFSPEDADLLTSVLAAKQADRIAAQQARDAAAAAAQTKSINLATLERLVRRGVRSLDDYDRTLADLGFDDGARAGMRELLELQIADDRKADALRAAHEAALRPKGLSLEQFRRAVVLGSKTIDQFAAFLVQQNFTADAVATLVADVGAAVAEADTARQRRRDSEARTGARALPLSTVARAARLGMVSPADYQARLMAAGYSADDVAIELELLVAEIADVQAARAKRSAADAGDADRALTLAQLERAVKAGVSSVEDYRALATATGYSADDVAILIGVLEAELAAAADARARRTTIDGELTARSLSLAQLEEAVTKGFTSIADYRSTLITWGYGADDADLLAALLLEELEKAAAKSGS